MEIEKPSDANDEFPFINEPNKKMEVTNSVTM